MSDSPAVLVDFVIVSSLVSLITEEVNLLEALVLYVSKSVGLVPASWEDIEGDLSTDAVCKVVGCELFLQEVDKVSSDIVLLVVGFEFVSLLYAVRVEVPSAACTVAEPD